MIVSLRIFIVGEFFRYIFRSVISLDNEVVFRRYVVNFELLNVVLDNGVLVNGK